MGDGVGGGLLAGGDGDLDGGAVVDAVVVDAVVVGAGESAGDEESSVGGVGEPELCANDEGISPS